MFESVDQMDSIDDLSFGDRRYCKVMKRSSELSKSDVTTVSKNKLLEASLNSLESMGRKMRMTGGMSNTAGSFAIDHLDDIYNESSINNNNNRSSMYPSEQYLKGALWIGRNLSMVVEDLADEMDKFRTKFLSEVNLANSDSNSRRSAHRLNLLAGSGITEALSLVGKSKNKTRNILQVKEYPFCDSISIFIIRSIPFYY